MPTRDRSNVRRPRRIQLALGTGEHRTVELAALRDNRALASWIREAALQEATRREAALLEAALRGSEDPPP